MNGRFTSGVRDAANGNSQFRQDRNSLLSDQVSRVGSGSRPASFVRLAQLRRLRECDQVAAVCYRVREGAIEFLLVQTRGGRWTFPKGSAEPGLTHAQAAALEAFEEAGVHGRMEEAPFTRFVYRKRGALRSDPAGLAVSAHLCEVLRLEAPEEANRNPTWFCTQDAKSSLREDHRTGSGAEMARVVVSAVRRIQRLQNERRAMENPARTTRVIDIDRLRAAARIRDG
jgi:8-oxo-dGTP pyrophosphatase MutT (NUDIX family)